MANRFESMSGFQWGSDEHRIGVWWPTESPSTAAVGERQGSSRDTLRDHQALKIAAAEDVKGGAVRFGSDGRINLEGHWHSGALANIRDADVGGRGLWSGSGTNAERALHHEPGTR